MFCPVRSEQMYIKSVTELSHKLGLRSNVFNESIANGDMKILNVFVESAMAQITDLRLALKKDPKSITFEDVSQYRRCCSYLAIFLAQIERNYESAAEFHNKALIFIRDAKISDSLMRGHAEMLTFVHYVRVCLEDNREEKARLILSKCQKILISSQKIKSSKNEDICNRIHILVIQAHQNFFEKTNNFVKWCQNGVQFLKYSLVYNRYAPTMWMNFALEVALKCVTVHAYEQGAFLLNSAKIMLDRMNKNHPDAELIRFFAGRLDFGFAAQILGLFGHQENMKRAKDKQARSLRLTKQEENSFIFSHDIITFEGFDEARELDEVLVVLPGTESHIVAAYKRMSDHLKLAGLRLNEEEKGQLDFEKVTLLVDNIKDEYECLRNELSQEI